MKMSLKSIRVRIEGLDEAAHLFNLDKPFIQYIRVLELWFKFNNVELTTLKMIIERRDDLKNTNE